MSDLTIKPMELAAQAAWQNIETGEGGPFGAAVVLDGRVIAVAANSVLADHDPTAHAEVNAIRQAAAALGTHDLSGCVLYATGYPCPMCLSAIIWANITQVYYASEVDGAAAIGFRDDAIYSFIRGEDISLLSLEQQESDASEGLYEAYAASSNAMY